MNNKINEELSRIKSMMTYGLQTEGKKQYSVVEYNKEGADGKMYGIVREGAKYYIKVGKSKKDALLKENYDYIGGFVNRKDNEYNSYANALKQFDLKMMSLKEAFGNGKNIIVESWNPDKNEQLTVEATEKMRKEIMRQRQIMGNAKLINEGKAFECCNGDPFCEKPKGQCKDGYCVEEPKNNIEGKSEPVVGKGAKAKSVNEKADRLAWHKTGGDAQETIADTYMDKSHGTEVGSDAPFTEPRHTNGKEMENGVVEEHNTAMAYASDNQNSPEPGTSPIGDDQPFDGEKGTQINEDLNPDEFDSANELDSVEEDGEPAPFDGEDEDPSLDSTFDDENVEDEDELEDMDGDVDDVDYELETDDVKDGDVDSRLTSIESTLQTILDKISDLEASQFDDDDELYDDSEDDEDFDEDFEEEPMDDEEFGDDEDFEGEDFGDDDIEGEDEQEEIYESRDYRRMRLAEENRLNDFGKHPGYRKVPMQLPPTGEDRNKHGRDWNDESVHSEQPYGEKIGSGKPFDISPEAIENSIAECVRKILKKKVN